MTEKFLNLSGVQRLWFRIKSYIDSALSVAIDGKASFDADLSNPAKATTTQGNESLEFVFANNDQVDFKISSGNVFATKSLPTRQYVDGIASSIPSTATDAESGTVKLNPNESITLNGNGQLQVGGRLGQFPDGGVYYPPNIEPTSVGAYSFMMSDGARKLNVAQRTFAILAGANFTCKSAPAGSTQYRISNTYQNRFAAYAISGGRLALNANAAASAGTAAILSIKYANGGNVTPHFGANESNNDIIITVDKTVNPDAATTQVRGYGTNNNTDNILIGQGVGAGGGKCVSLGQSTYAGGNQTIALGNSVIILGNNSSGFGNTILIPKQFCFGAGQGHDFTNAVNGTAAFGTWGEIGSQTRFAVGDGTSNTARSNAFEIIKDGNATSAVIKSPNGTRFKISVADNGTLSATPA